MKKHTITISPLNREIEVESGQNLMTSLFENSIYLRSDCGGKGFCGKCHVKIKRPLRDNQPHSACTVNVVEDISIELPDPLEQLCGVIKKAPVTLPNAFLHEYKDVSTNEGKKYGIAVDLGTTTMALYLCNMTHGEVLGSLSMKNPQALYGADVMSRIAAVAEKRSNLGLLQNLVVKSIEWGCEQLVGENTLNITELAKLVVVGNPAMIHIFLGIDPAPIGIAPHAPVFKDARRTHSAELGFKQLLVHVNTLPQVSGFIGGDILAATLASGISEEPVGTLLADIGTNGEIVYKSKNGLYATSCATGPAFEGASITCGMQATPGAIERVVIADRYSLPQIEVIKKTDISEATPSTGLCGSGVISCAAELYRAGIIGPDGAFVIDSEIKSLVETLEYGKSYLISYTADENGTAEVVISQKDIRSIQLGKAALVTGIEFLVQEDGKRFPTNIILAGAFGSNLDRGDMVTLGMLPGIELQKIENRGNLAGAGAVMILCNDRYLQRTKDIASEIKVVDLALDSGFQNSFVQNLSFPDFEKSNSSEKRQNKPQR